MTITSIAPPGAAGTMRRTTRCCAASGGAMALKPAAAIPSDTRRRSIIMVSSDMPEVISMSDRVIIMKNGESMAELSADEVSEENILTYSIGDKAI